MIARTATASHSTGGCRHSRTTSEPLYAHAIRLGRSRTTWWRPMVSVRVGEGDGLLSPWRGHGSCYGLGGNRVGTRATEMGRGDRPARGAETAVSSRNARPTEIGRDQERRIIIRVSGVRVPPPLP